MSSSPLRALPHRFHLLPSRARQTPFFLSATNLTQSATTIQTQPFPRLVRTQSRPITNATKPDYIPSLTSLPRGPHKPDGNWFPTLFHSSGQVKFTLIRLPPGKSSSSSSSDTSDQQKQSVPPGEVPPHKHTVIWDYFIPVQGEAVIETTTADGVRRDYEMREGSFLAVGPGDVHRVRNVSGENEFAFVLAQAPRGEYDFVRVGKEDVDQWRTSIMVRSRY